jgi:hypothetical protein
MKCRPAHAGPASLSSGSLLLIFAVDDGTERRHVDAAHAIDEL